MRYNWQQVDWPAFRYNLNGIEEDLAQFQQQTELTGKAFNVLPEKTRHEAIMELVVTEAIKTSEIEGEYISRQDVISSIRNHLGLNLEPEGVHDQRAKGAAQLMLVVRNTFDEALSVNMLFHWHRTLLASSRHIITGAWRSHVEPMRVISGGVDEPTIHFEAPPSARVPQEMARYIAWYNDSACTLDSPVVRSAIAHLYFESIHPFEDGNGRIGRALSEKVLSQGLGRPALLSLSKAIETHKKSYYRALESAQRSNEITDWISYFVRMALDAQADADRLIDFILKKARFYDRYHNQLDKNQLKVINRMLAEGPKGFQGGMSAKKYSVITGVSKATATRHLQQLAEIGALNKQGAGRSTRYFVYLHD
jgi:Fic family protein